MTFHFVSNKTFCFIEQRKLIDDNATNAFFWKYVVEGKTNPNEGEEKSLERIVVDRKKGIDDAKVEILMKAISSWLFLISIAY